MPFVTDMIACHSAAVAGGRVAAAVTKCTTLKTVRTTV
jgi:hypothetical protein